MCEHYCEINVLMKIFSFKQGTFVLSPCSLHTVGLHVSVASHGNSGALGMILVFNGDFIEWQSPTSIITVKGFF